MWYWIIALIFFALILAAIAVIWRICDIRNETTTDVEDVLEVIHIILLLSVVGAVLWPLLTLIILFIVLYNIFLKDVFNKIVDWINDRI